MLLLSAAPVENTSLTAFAPSVFSLQIDLTSDEHKFIAPGPNDIRGEFFLRQKNECRSILASSLYSPSHPSRHLPFVSVSSLHLTSPGPCPGLNLLSNHGYLNRNGVTTLTQGIDAIGKVFGVEVDLGLALNAYAVVFNGNILDTTWSIGGKYASKGLGSLTNLLFGEPAGINAHNVYEGDASIVRQGESIL